MKILIAGLVESHQITRLKEEAEKRGHTVHGCHSSALILTFDENGFTHTVRNADPLESYDLVYSFVGKHRREDWMLTLEHLKENHGVVVVNQKIADPNYKFLLTSASDYLKQQKNNLPTPKSHIFYSINSLKLLKDKIEFPTILKLYGEGLSRKGKGVNLIKTYEDLKNIVRENQDKVEKFILREFIPNDGDIRVFIVGYKAIGAMKRTPKSGDFRSNISQGGSGEEFDLNSRPDVKEIAEKVSRVMRTEIAGVDVILNKDTGVPYILETNSNPQFVGFEEYTNKNAALEIVKYFEDLIAGKAEQSGVR